MTKQNTKPRRTGLQGPNLWHDPRTGLYVWRRTHALTGKRFRKSTGTKNLRIALARVQQFEEEYEREIAGLSKFQGYRRPLAGLLDPFLESLACNDHRRRQLRMNLDRAFRLLKLDVLAAIEDFTKVEAKLLRLDGKNDFNATTLVRGFQAPLKQFSAYLAGRREVLSDHLAAWPTLKKNPPKRIRRALLPDEMARALAASDCLDRLWSRPHPMRPVWTTLLVAAPRASALANLDVGDIDSERQRLLLSGNGNKRSGAGNLDDATYAELCEYVGGRTAGPLFLSPEGKRVDARNNVRRWKAAVSLAAVDLEWPQDDNGDASDFRLTYMVHYALMTGHVRVAMGGPLTGLHAPGPQKLASREKQAKRVRALVQAIKPGWEERMRGVDQHCLRMTHRTWALAASVPEVLIDRQLGHASPAGDAALRAAWSAVGRKHYTDMGFLTADARRSAEAVRGVLDRAEEQFAELAQQGGTALLRADNRFASVAAGSGG